MNIGYACINTSIECTTNSTFRLKNYSEERLIETVKNNLQCFKEILKWNLENKVYFFRLGSQLVPFASHPVCKFNWRKYFKEEFKEIGDYIKKHNMRITMHPDQFVIINALDSKIVERSVKELQYHNSVLDLLGLDNTCKIVLHVGGVYNDKEKSMKRFVENYKKIPSEIKKRLVIENDHRSYSLKDCLEINEETGVPIVFDSFHHECLNNGEKLKTSVLLSEKTWKKKDGPLIMHYSNQKKDGIKGSHSETINIKLFKKFQKEVKGIKLDVMLEVKDKEKSLLKLKKS